ncbi:MAG: IS110 family transposase [Candidatus Dormibacteraceae bacterium]
MTDNSGDTAPTGNALYVGIDVGRSYHVVAAIPQDRMESGKWLRIPSQRIPTSGSGFRHLTEWIVSFGTPTAQVEIGIEPSGGWYASTVASWLERNGYRIQWLQNWTVHERRQLVTGQQAKTDALDARVIARLLYERTAFGLDRGFMHHRPRYADPLRMLVRNRGRLVESRIRYRLQLTAIEDVLFPELKEFFKKSITGITARSLLENFPTPHDVALARPDDLYKLIVVRCRATRFSPLIPLLQDLAKGSAGLVTDLEPIVQTQQWLLQHLRVIDAQVAETEVAMAEALRSWPAEQLTAIATLPLMSVVRRATLLSAIGDITTFRDDRQLRKLFGWYPETKESGTSLNQHALGKSGNRIARREMWLWAMELTSPQHPHTPFRAYYQRLRDRGMPGHNAIGHLAAKLVTVLFFCLRRGEPYDPVRHARDLGVTDF